MNIEHCSNIFIRSNNILSKKGKNKVKIENGKRIKDTNGTNIILINGLNKFIVLKLFTNIGILTTKHIKEIFIVFNI